MCEFGALVEREIPHLRRYAVTLTRNRMEADDLVQHCLVHALAKLYLWKPGTNIRAWLFTILHNLRVNDLRRLAREEACAASAAAHLLVKSSRPDDRLELHDLDRAIGSLVENQRRVLLLIGLDGMDYEQAAAILGVPTGTVRSRLGRARSTLRKRLSRPATSKHRLRARLVQQSCS